MIVGVDGGSIGVTDDRLKVGVYQVVTHALESLVRLDVKNEYKIYSFIPIDNIDIPKDNKRIQNVVLSPSRGYQRIRLPLELTMHPADVFLGFAQAMPPKQKHGIGFIYDLGPFQTPDVYGLQTNRLQKQTDTLVARSERIITISRTSKETILDKYRIPSDRVVVAYPGTDVRYSPSGAAYSHARPYFLTVGSLNKAKDLTRALRAFHAFNAASGLTHDFLLAGGDYWPDPAIKETIRQFNLESCVYLLGYVPDSALPALYRGAVALVSTALHEGFCPPAAESMACGTPVIAVPKGALAEVVGAGGIVTRDSETGSIVGAMESITTNRSLRSRLSENAVKRSALFSWDTFARTILSLYPETGSDTYK